MSEVTKSDLERIWQKMDELVQSIGEHRYIADIVKRHEHFIEGNGKQGARTQLALLNNFMEAHIEQIRFIRRAFWGALCTALAALCINTGVFIWQTHNEKLTDATVQRVYAAIRAQERQETKEEQNEGITHADK